MLFVQKQMTSEVRAELTSSILLTLKTQLLAGNETQFDCWLYSKERSRIGVHKV